MIRWSQGLSQGGQAGLVSARQAPSKPSAAEGESGEDTSKPSLNNWYFMVSWILRFFLRNALGADWSLFNIFPFWEPACAPIKIVEVMVRSGACKSLTSCVKPMERTRQGWIWCITVLGRSKGVMLQSLFARSWRNFPSTYGLCAL